MQSEISIQMFNYSWNFSQHNCLNFQGWGHFDLYLLCYEFYPLNQVIQEGCNTKASKKFSVDRHCILMIHEVIFMLVIHVCTLEISLYVYTYTYYRHT